MKFLPIRLADDGLSGDHDEMLAHTEADAWIQFAAAGLYDGRTVEKAAESADKMLEQFRSRFTNPYIKGEPS